MNWLKWTTRGWQALSNVLYGGPTERDEEARLVGGLVELQRVQREPATAILEAANDAGCPCCGGSHCWVWRSSKHTHGCGGHAAEDKCQRSDEDGVRIDGCGGEAEPIPAGASFLALMDQAMTTPGRHTLRYIVDHAVAWGWNPIPLRIRVMRWPAAAQRRFGRPVQLGIYTRGVVLP